MVEIVKEGWHKARPSLLRATTMMLDKFIPKEIDYGLIEDIFEVEDSKLKLRMDYQ